jgi:hypothetical protein
MRYVTGQRADYRYAMIENEQYEIELSQAARKIAQTAREIADGAHIVLTAMKWHRGHEVADLDNFWLTLTSDKQAVTEHFPNEWLEAFGKSDVDARVAQRLSGMVEALAPPPEPHATRTLPR